MTPTARDAGKELLNHDRSSRRDEKTHFIPLPFEVFLHPVRHRVHFALLHRPAFQTQGGNDKGDRAHTLRHGPQ